MTIDPPERTPRTHVRCRTSVQPRVGRAIRAAVVLSAVCVGGLATPLGPTATVAAGPLGCADTGAVVHEVRDGDTWFGIAAAAGVSMRSLLELNGGEPDDTIHPGDELCLPTGAKPIASSASSSSTAPTCGAAASYTVASGDSWFGIARRVATDMDELLDVNGAEVTTVLQPGAKVCLPASAKLTVATNAVVALEALPVQGPCWYGDTWQAPRGAGRRHEGVDLIVESGKYVYAVADGVLTRRAWDQPGSRSGNAWWLTTADGTYYFYAHLSDFAPDLKVGSTVQAGQIIGFVGNTGNSATAHLHFEIHPHGGEPINPYPTVKAAGGCRRGAGYTQPGGWVPET